MRKKRNDDSIKFSDWTTRKLKRWARDLHSCIYGPSACYGTKDLRNYEGALAELGARDIEYSTELNV